MECIEKVANECSSRSFKGKFTLYLPLDSIDSNSDGGIVACMAKPGFHAGMMRHDSSRFLASDILKNGLGSDYMK